MPGFAHRRQTGIPVIAPSFSGQGVLPLRLMPGSIRPLPRGRAWVRTSHSGNGGAHAGARGNPRHVAPSSVAGPRIDVVSDLAHKGRTGPTAGRAIAYGGPGIEGRPDPERCGLSARQDQAEARPAGCSQAGVHSVAGFARRRWPCRTRSPPSPKKLGSQRRRQVRTFR